MQTLKWFNQKDSKDDSRIKIGFHVIGTYDSRFSRSTQLIRWPQIKLRLPNDLIHISGTVLAIIMTIEPSGNRLSSRNAISIFALKISTNKIKLHVFNVTADVFDFNS